MEQPRPRRLTIGDRGIAHHGEHSGYGRLLAAMRTRLPVRHLDGARPSRLPPALVRRLSARTRLPWYDASAFGVDVGLAAALWRGETGHLLHAEDALHYSGLARRLGAPGRLVATFHQPPSVLDGLIEDHRPLPGVDAAIALSRELRDHLAAWLGEERTEFIPLGIDSAYWRPPENGAGGPPSCLFVGWWQRDLAVLGEVVERVRAGVPGTQFEAVVPPWTVDRVRAATGIEPVAGISDAELRRRYQEAAVVVLPLTAAVANNALVEAAACGRAIVVTDVGGVRDYVDAECAELVPAGDAARMAGCVRGLLENADRRERLGRRARARALELDWERVAERHLEVYRRACAARAPA